MGEMMMAWQRERASLGGGWFLVEMGIILVFHGKIFIF
jgi:hypothetical protein